MNWSVRVQTFRGIIHILLWIRYGKVYEILHLKEKTNSAKTVSNATIVTACTIYKSIQNNIKHAENLTHPNTPHSAWNSLTRARRHANVRSSEWLCVCACVYGRAALGCIAAATISDRSVTIRPPLERYTERAPRVQAASPQRALGFSSRLLRARVRTNSVSINCISYRVCGGQPVFLYGRVFSRTRRFLSVTRWSRRHHIHCKILTNICAYLFAPVFYGVRVLARDNPRIIRAPHANITSGVNVRLCVRARIPHSWVCVVYVFNRVCYSVSGLVSEQRANAWCLIERHFSGCDFPLRRRARDKRVRHPREKCARGVCDCVCDLRIRVLFEFCDLWAFHYTQYTNVSGAHSFSFYVAFGSTLLNMTWCVRERLFIHYKICRVFAVLSWEKRRSDRESWTHTSTHSHICVRMSTHGIHIQW